MAGHITVPVYPTLTHETVAYILEHSESKLLFVGKLVNSNGLFILVILLWAVV